MGTIPKTRSIKSVPFSCSSCTTYPSMRSGSEDSVISAYGGRRSSGNVRIKGGASAQSEVHKHLSLQTKAFQNELVEANRIIEELKRENRSLRTIQNRQDVALSKFQSENAVLPQLLNSHAAEMRVWQTKIQSLRKINKDLEQKLKVKESIILSLNDQIDYYRKLNKDRNLEERDRLAKKLEKMELKLKERDDDMKHLERKFLVEQKTLKRQLREQQKNAKEVEVQLKEALLYLEEYEKLNDLSDNPVGKPSKTSKPKPKQEYEKKEGSKSDLDCSKPGFRYSKSVGSWISKPSLGSSRVDGNAKKLGITRANNSDPRNSVGYIQQNQLPQQKQCKPLPRKAKKLQPENMADEKNLTATSDSDYIEFKVNGLDYTDTRDEEGMEKDSKGKLYFSDLEDLYGDEDDLDANQIDNYWEKHLITTRELSKDDGLCDIYAKFSKNQRH